MSFACVLVLISIVSLQNEKKSGPVSAPIHYQDLMLVISTKDHVLAIVFEDEIDSRSADGSVIEKGVKYRSRSWSRKHTKEVCDNGILVEKIKYTKTANPRKIAGVDAGSERVLAIGGKSVEWGYRTRGGGWLYYSPEEVTVQIGLHKDFETVLLSRFAR